MQEKDKERDPYGWLLCTSRTGHDPDKLMPTQIIAGNALECMGHLVHSYRKQWNIVQFCDCPDAVESNKSILATNPNSVAANSINGNANFCKVRVAISHFFSGSIIVVVVVVVVISNVSAIHSYSNDLFQLIQS